MIVATVQGNEEVGKHITVKNGKKITGKEQQEAINQLYDKVWGINIKGDFGIEELRNRKEIFCYTGHPEVDSSGRKEIAFIVWDKKENPEIIERTIKEIGLDYDKFIINYNEFIYNKREEKNDSGRFSLRVLATIIILAINK